ncbi:MAG: hypothetical protein V2G41_09820 [bacterium JZ-2024 1]
MKEESVKERLDEALRGLEKAVEELKSPTNPRAPMPCPRIFYVTANLRWPFMREVSEGFAHPVWDWMSEKTGRFWDLSSSKVTFAEVGDVILESASPKEILRAIRRIEAAAEWCRRRRSGMLRHSEEIKNQQRGAWEALEAEITFRRLLSE